MDPKIRSVINIISIIAYIIIILMFRDILILRFIGIIALAAVQISISAVIIFLKRGSSQARRMEISMIAFSGALAAYVIYKMHTSL